jgi:hypothetical protein
MPTDPTDFTGPSQPGDPFGEGDDGAGGGHPVLELWAELRAVADKLTVATTWSMSDRQARAAVRAGHDALAVVEAARLVLVRDLDGRPTAVAGARTGQVARSFLMQALNESGRQAASDVRAARALAPDRPAVEGGLPHLAAAFAAGQVSRRHIDAAGKVMSDLPSGPARALDDQGRSGADRVEEFLAEQARIVDPDALAALGRQVLARLDPDAGDEYDADAYRRRFLSMVVAPDGMTLLKGALPGAQAAAVRAALDAFAAPQPASEQPDQDGRPVLITDDRTRGQRLADALVALARARTAGCDGGEAGGEPAHVTIITDLEQLTAARSLTGASSLTGAGGGSGGRRAVGLAHGTGHGPLSTAALALLSCDARLRAVVLDEHGAVLHLGRSQRLASKAQRIALAARDRGCVVPGCGAPAEWCDAHHVTYWSSGGGTDIDTLALVCPRHHTDLHHGVWQLRMRDGIPWARPPAWAALRTDAPAESRTGRHPTGQHPPDGAGPWVRNTVHHTMDTARRLGEQLRLDLANT